MSKIIKITTNDEISVHEFPKGSYSEQNKVLQELIGNDCEIYEHVLPNRLYTELGMSNRPTKISGQCVSMLVDELGLMKAIMKPNAVASYLYQTDKHGNPIIGNVLFVGEEWTDDGVAFCGIEDSVFDKLYKELTIMTAKAKGEIE